MSRAFTKDSDDERLDEVAPAMAALSGHLTRENGGIPVYEKKCYTDSAGRTIHEMNNGFSYVLNAQGKWTVLEN